MFKTPKSLKYIVVMGVKVKVIIDKNMEDMGMYKEDCIHLKPEYDCGNDFVNTVVHETAHAHMHHLGLQLDIQIEEILATMSERVYSSVTKELNKLF